MRTLSVNALASAMAENTAEVWLIFLTITHSDLSNPLYICSNNEDVVSNGNTFTGLPFEISFPEQTQEQLGSVSISVPNIDLSLVTLIRPVIEPPLVTIQVALASSPNTIEMEIDGLTMRDIEYDADVLRATLRFFSLLSEPISEIQTPDRFPALF